MNTKTLITLSAATVVALSSTALAGNAVANAHRNIASYIVPPTSHYEGKSYSEWLQAAEERHWNIPSTGVAPNFGSPEYDADPQQLQGGPVFFLDFSWNLDPYNPVPDVRHATVPKGTAILADIDGFYSFRRTIDELWVRVAPWTYFETLVIDGVEIPIGSSLDSPYWTSAAFTLDIPADSASRAMGAGGQVGTQNFAILELITILKPLPVGEHLIEIKGGNTANGDPQGTDQNIWWNWVAWHITVTP
jgi:hypothetical protein